MFRSDVDAIAHGYQGVNVPATHTFHCNYKRDALGNNSESVETACYPGRESLKATAA